MSSGQFQVKLDKECKFEDLDYGDLFFDSKKELYVKAQVDLSLGNHDIAISLKTGKDNTANIQNPIFKAIRKEGD